jgi:hypothetical protein
MGQPERGSRIGTQRLAVSAACARSLSPTAPLRGSVGTRLPTFRVKAADRARVAYMPGTAWPVSGLPPGSSWDLVRAPVSMPSKTDFDTSTAKSLRSPSRSPPDALNGTPFPRRSPRTAFSRRSTRWFEASPAGRLRGASFPHLPHSTALIETHLHRNLALCVRGANTMRVLSRLSSRPTCANRSMIASRTIRACCSLLQCRISSSA